MGKNRKLYKRGKQQKRRAHWRNEHHLLFPKQEWNNSFYGCKIRNHSYFQRFIPENTLHKWLHEGVSGVPLPPSWACKRAYRKFLKMYDKRQVCGKKDTMEQRLQVLIDLWSDFRKQFFALEAQKEIATRFYNKGRRQ